MKYKLIIPLALILFSCAKKVNTQTVQKTTGPWEISSIDVQDDIVKFSIKNTLDKALLIHKPMEKKISYQTEDGWRDVNILYCDCGSNCPPPPEQLAIEPKGNFTFSWDLNEEECANEGNNRTTLKTHAPKGNYVAKFMYSAPGSREKKPLEIPFILD